MEYRISIDRKALEKQVKKAKSREARQARLQKISKFYYRNERAIKVTATAAASVLTTAVPIVVKNRKLKKAQQLKEHYCYDNKLGHYWKLRRELTSKEWLEINRRKALGESLGEILQEFKVLK